MKASSLLKKVKADYSAIAEAFDETRKAPWPEFEDLWKGTVSRLNRKTLKLLDVGCGNGRLLNFLPNDAVDYRGVDNNRALLSLAKKRHPKAKFRYADALKLPFPNATFDTVWCIAMLHHLPASLQLNALKEMHRVLKKNGVLALTVWNLFQPRYKKFVNRTTHESLIPWGKDKSILRYYYAFTNLELKNLLKKAGFSSLKKIKSKHNLVYLCTRRD